jgi:L-ascorbate metabolism protein UlaG (beta-lactamase superfamily)
MSTSPVTVTWVGHSTNLIDVGGYRVITDPLLTKRVAHLRRRRDLPSAETADVDVALLSHVHLDHIHIPSIKRLRPTTALVVPRNAGPLLRKAGFTDVTEVVEGDLLEVGPLRVEVVHAEHKHGRGPHTKLTASPLGFIVDSDSTGEHRGHRVYYPGDTDLFDDMATFDDIDLALLPIWGWGSTLGTGHLDPPRAAHAAELIHPRMVVPIHWGTYAPEDGRRGLPRWFTNPPEQFIAAMEATGQSDILRVLDPGQSITLN